MSDTPTAEASAVRLPDMEKLIVSSSPHLHSGDRVPRIMALVLVALLPAVVAGLYFFGPHALRVLVLCVVGCVACEALFARLAGRQSTVGDFSAALTGVLLGLNLSATTPWWVCLMGAVLAMGLGKHLYGGLGYNPFNPALVARVALLIAFPGHLTTWVGGGGANAAGELVVAGADAISGATPLYAVPQALQQGLAVDYPYLSYFIGRVGGCIGETSALALLLGGVVLVAARLIRWQLPVAYVGTVFGLTAIIHHFDPSGQPTPLFHLLTGGLLLGALFMATDMVTSPVSKTGAVIFGVGCGLVTTVIRVWGSYPEGVSFSILFMNALTPFIDRYTGHKPFGMRRAVGR